MPAFLALYRGETVSEARLVALSADPSLVRDFTTRLLADEPGREHELEQADTSKSTPYFLNTRSAPGVAPGRPSA